MYTNLIKVLVSLSQSWNYDAVRAILYHLDIEGSANALDEFIYIAKLFKNNPHVDIPKFEQRIKNQMLKYRSELEIDEVFKRL
jgi:hypothetical protein